MQKEKANEMRFRSAWSMLAAAMCAASLLPSECGAMPSQAEMNGAKPIVAELMEGPRKLMKAGKMSAAEVGEKAIFYAGESDGEAAKLLFLSEALECFCKGRDYEGAADAAEAMRDEIPGFPPALLAKKISKAAGRAKEREAGRLLAICKEARSQAAALKEVQALASALKKTPERADLRRQMAETLVLAGDWRRALDEFSKLGGKAGEIAKAELEGKADYVATGDFWWDYKPAAAKTDEAFKVHAAAFYREALDDKKVDGIKEQLLAKRVGEMDAAKEGPQAKAGVKGSAKPVKAGLFDGLVAYYALDGDALDSSGNGNDGVNHGATPAPDRKGRPNSAMHFGGTVSAGSYMEIPDSKSLSEANCPITVAAWVKIDLSSALDNWMPILCKGASRCPWGWKFWKKNNEYIMLLNDDYGGRGDWLVLNYDRSKIVPGKWCFVAMTYDGNELVGYIDGAQFGSQKVSFRYKSNNEPLFIGKDPPGGKEYFHDGSLDEIFIFKRALSQREIKSLWRMSGHDKNTLDRMAKRAKAARGK